MGTPRNIKMHGVADADAHARASCWRFSLRHLHNFRASHIEKKPQRCVFFVVFCCWFWAPRIGCNKCVAHASAINESLKYVFMCDCACAHSCVCVCIYGPLKQVYILYGFGQPNYHHSCFLMFRCVFAKQKPKECKYILMSVRGTIRELYALFRTKEFLHHHETIQVKCSTQISKMLCARVFTASVSDGVLYIIANTYFFRGQNQNHFYFYSIRMASAPVGRAACDQIAPHRTSRARLHLFCLSTVRAFASHVITRGMRLLVDYICAQPICSI